MYIALSYALDPDFLAKQSFKSEKPVKDEGSLELRHFKSQIFLGHQQANLVSFQRQ